MLRQQLIIHSRAHTGTIKSGLNFSEVHTGWKTPVEEPFLAYLDGLFSASALFFHMITPINIHPARKVRQDFALPDTISTQDQAEGQYRWLHTCINVDSTKFTDASDDGSDNAQNETINFEDMIIMSPEASVSDPKEQEQENPKQDDGVGTDVSTSRAASISHAAAAILTLDTVSNPGAASTSNLLLESGDWPRWLTDAIDHLKTISKAKTWVTLLESYAMLERSMGFIGLVSKHWSQHLLKAN